MQWILMKYQIDEELEEDEFDELEYTGPNEGQVYERFEKIKKSFNQLC